MDGAEVMQLLTGLDRSDPSQTSASDEGSSWQTLCGDEGIIWQQTYTREELAGK